MRGTRRHLVSFGAIAVALIAPTLMATAHAGATDWGPPPWGEIRDCLVRVDPPADAPIQIVVHVHNVTVDGQPVSYDMSLPYLHPGHEILDFSLDAVPAMQVPGDHTVHAEATWNIGTGTLILDGTAHCADAPPTTPPPTTAPPTTPPPIAPPTTATPPSVLGTTVVPVTQPANSNVSVEANTATNTDGSGQLPFTGGGTGPLLFVGLGCVAGGVAMVRAFRRRTATR